ncbi:hypothetical protein [Pectobacterium parmentieri]|uniref:hypothetical protein n=1 Tax=Pectobacterium parmentieri TaxID=1905730 RepID=UPI0012B5A06E|nr:hypothetical protein [Pectobacterium parmentieri]
MVALFTVLHDVESCAAIATTPFGYLWWAKISFTGDVHHLFHHCLLNESVQNGEQRLQMLNETINKSVGSDLKNAGRKAGLQPGDKISAIIFN